MVFIWNLRFEWEQLMGVFKDSLEPDLLFEYDREKMVYALEIG